MRKQTFFQLNRVILLSIVAFSVIIPLVQLPQTMQPVVSFQLAPVADKIVEYDLNLPAETAPTGTEVAGQPVETISPKFAIAWPKLLQMIYLSGLLVALLVSLTGFLNILVLFRKVPAISKDGFRLLIAPGDIPAFSLGRYLFISKSDFETNGDTILTHEKAHIRHGHFYDLLFIELVKIIYWFNPVIYWLNRDLKAVHEFQADDSTLNNGIDATQYQLLIIQKCVGHQRFALANSFNHCQIKNRIVMMNKQKTSKAWSWKAAAFLPMLALLLMAFGRTGENVPRESIESQTLVQKLPLDSVKKWSESDFKTMNFSKFKKEKAGYFFNGIKILSVLMNAQSRLLVDNNPAVVEDVPNYIRKFRDYNSADEKTKLSFKKVVINGKDKMGATSFILIRKDLATSLVEYQKLLNSVGNTILEIREKYSSEIFGSSYSKLNTQQKSEIDQLIPMEVYIGIPDKQVNLKSIPPPPPPPLVIELIKDKIYVDNKLNSLEELSKQLELLVTNNPKRLIRIKLINDSDKKLETKVVDMMKKRNASYQISWASK